MEFLSVVNNFETSAPLHSREHETSSTEMQLTASSAPEVVQSKELSSAGKPHSSPNLSIEMLAAQFHLPIAAVVFLLLFK